MPIWEWGNGSLQFATCDLRLAARSVNFHISTSSHFQVTGYKF